MFFFLRVTRCTDDGLLFDQSNLDRSVGTGRDARWCLTAFDPLPTHIAFPYDSQSPIVLGDFVGTGHRAILTPDALIVQMVHDSRTGIFFISQHWAAIKAPGIDAVVARSSDVVSVSR